MSDVRRDLIAAGLVLAVAVVFWSRMDFTTDTDVIFPRFVLAGLAVLGVLTAVMALVRARKGGTAPAPESVEGAEPHAAADPDLPPEAANVAAAAGTESSTIATAESPRATSAPEGGENSEDAGEPEGAEQPGAARSRWVMPVSAALLIGWGAAFGLFGITLSGVVAFVATALLIRGGVSTWRRLLLDVGVGLILVLFCWALFTRVLFVPLPVSVILGV